MIHEHALPALSHETDAGTLHDVTHLPCRSARYTPLADASGSPANVKAGTSTHHLHCPNS